jgi:hypothetical protein
VTTLLDDLLEAERSPLLPREKVTEASYDEKLHPRDRAGRWAKTFNAHMKGPFGGVGKESSARHQAAYHLGPGNDVQVVAGPQKGHKGKITSRTNAGDSGMLFTVEGGGKRHQAYGSQVKPTGEMRTVASPKPSTTKLDKPLPRKRRKLGEDEAEFALAMLRLTEAGLYVEPPLEESAKTAGYSVTHAPRGKGGTNWITKSKPGNAGQLPAYIQNVRNGIARGTKDLGKATAIAIGRIRTWARGGGGVHAEVKAAAAKALAQYDAMRKKVGRSSSGAKKLAEAEGDDADFDFTALLAQVRAQPNAVPFIAHVRSVPPTAPAVSGSYPDDEGGEVSIGEAYITANPRPKKTPTTTPTTTPASSGGVTTSRQRWAKWETAHEGQQGGVVQGVQARVGVKQDGQFGAKTKAAVVRFQQKNGLKVDGVVGRQTFAAFAGHKNASSVKVGKLSATQASQLANFSKHGGTLMTRSAASKRARKLGATAALKASAEDPELDRLLAEMLVEAERATHAEFPDRVKSLKQGEVARMPDGHAVRRISTQDGRDVFQVGSPREYGDTPGEVSYYSDHHRKAEDAVHSARTRSARSRDPESLGGKTSYFHHDSVSAGGRPAVFQGVDMSGNALVLHRGAAKPRAVPFSDLTSGVQEGLLESASGVADRFTPFS